MQHILRLALFAWALAPAAAVAETSAVSLSLDEAIERAARSAPRAVEAATEVDVATAEVVEAREAWTYNPRVGVSAGPRIAETSSLDFEVEVEQPFALGRPRAAAVDVAELGVDVASAEAQARRRELAANAAAAYLRALHAERRLQIARESRELGERIAAVALRRFEAGESDRLQANTAALALGRLDVEVAQWESRVMQRKGELRAILGVEPMVELRLTSTLEQPSLPSVETLREAARNLPELAAIEAARRREAARLTLADAMRWPVVDVGGSYAYEEGAHVVRGALGFTLPFFANGRGERALASALAEQLDARFDATWRALDARLTAAIASYVNLREAETAFRNEVVPVLEANETMMRQAYEAGAVALPELLTMRTEMIAARESYADLLLEVALAIIETRTLAGQLTPQGEAP